MTLTKADACLKRTIRVLSSFKDVPDEKQAEAIESSKRLQRIAQLSWNQIQKSRLLIRVSFCKV
jgi:hypothetical protein